MLDEMKLAERAEVAEGGEGCNEIGCCMNGKWLVCVVKVVGMCVEASSTESSGHGGKCPNFCNLLYPGTRVSVEFDQGGRPKV